MWFGAPRQGNGLSHPKPDSKMQRKRTGPEWAARAPSGKTLEDLDVDLGP